jgi:putative copper export protein/Cu/Ag efflux protein CusF
MDWLDVALPLLRGLDLAAVLSAFGIALFRVAVAPGAVSASGVPLLTALRASLAAAIVLALLWLPVEAAGMAGVRSLAAGAAATTVVLFRTHFGTALLLRLIALLLALMSAQARGGLMLAGLSAAAAGAALSLQAAMGHAAAANDLALPVAEVLHLLAAGAWLGGLLPLLLLLRHARSTTAAAAARRFSLLGIVAVVTLLCTSVVQSGELIGGVAGFAGTAYGRTALAKLALFAVLLCLAGINRYELTPNLEGSAARAYVARLACSIMAEMALGLAVVLLAGYLATEVPAVHEMPLWHFSLRPEWRAFPAAAATQEAVIACVAVVALAAVGGAWRRFRWRGGLLAAVLLCILAATQVKFEALPKLVHGTGTVIAIQPQAGLLVVDGDEIRGFMAAMTMPYRVASPALLADLAPDERVQFDIDPATAVIVAIRRMSQPAQ